MGQATQNSRTTIDFLLFILTTCLPICMATAEPEVD